MDIIASILIILAGLVYGVPYIQTHDVIPDAWEIKVKQILGSGGGYTSSAGITSLGGLTGGTQTFTNDTNVTVTSSGSDHALGWSGTLARTRGGWGAAVDFGVNSPLLGNGTGAILASSSPSFGQLNATTTATSTIYGGFWAQSGGGGVRSDNGLSITAGSITNSSAATSTFTSGGLILNGGGLESLGGVRISGGSLLVTGATSTVAGLFVNSLSSSGGINITTGSLVVGGATSSFTGYVTTGGLTSSNGIVNTGGSVNNTSSATSTWAGGILLTGSADVCNAAGNCLNSAVGGGGSSLFTDGGATTYLTATGDGLAVASTSIDTTQYRLGVQGGAIISGTTTVGTLVSTSTTFFVGATSTRYTLPDFPTASSTVLVSNGEGLWRGQAEGMDLVAECNLANAATTCELANVPLRRFYHLDLNVVGLGASAIGFLRFNADSGANYGHGVSLDNAAAESSAADSSCAYSGTTNRALVGAWSFYITGSTAMSKAAVFRGATISGTAVPVKYDGACTWNSSVAITSITVGVTQATTYSAGSSARLWASRN